MYMCMYIYIRIHSFICTYKYMNTYCVMYVYISYLYMHMYTLRVYHVDRVTALRRRGLVLDLYGLEFRVEGLRFRVEC